jgi:site-specific recombinase XerD
LPLRLAEHLQEALSPVQATSQGRRDHALLLLLYNSGVRADEAAQVLLVDLLVRGRGEGEKELHFLRRRGERLTRFGIPTRVERYAAPVAENMPAVATKRVSPHTIRHTTATHRLPAGVDSNTIRAWLGHVSLATTNIYAEVDQER